MEQPSKLIKTLFVTIENGRAHMVRYQRELHLHRAYKFLLWDAGSHFEEPLLLVGNRQDELDYHRKLVWAVKHRRTHDLIGAGIIKSGELVSWRSGDYGLTPEKRRPAILKALGLE